MISCEEYQLLDELLQVQLLKLDGTYLMLRKTSKLDVELFALYDFYVEVFFNTTDKEPLYFKSFECGKTWTSTWKPLLLTIFLKSL